MAAPESCLLPVAKHSFGRAHERSFTHVEECAVDVKSCLVHAEKHPVDAEGPSTDAQEHARDGEFELSFCTEFIHLPCIPPDSSEQEEEGIFLAGKYFLPPGFRFHPTDQELLLYYLKRKICGLRMELDIIAEIDLYEFEPWDLHDVSCLQTKDLLWYFFCPKMRKYPKGNRENRATPIGRWKPSGKDRPVLSGSRLVGTRKCLIYYDRRAKKEERTDWVMHEFRLSDDQVQRLKSKQNDFVLTRVFKKNGRGSKRGQLYGAMMEEEEVESLHEMKVDGCGSGYSIADQEYLPAGDKELQLCDPCTDNNTPSQSTETEVTVKG